MVLTPFKNRSANQRARGGESEADCAGFNPVQKPVSKPTIALSPRAKAIGRFNPVQKPVSKPTSEVEGILRSGVLF